MDLHLARGRRDQPQTSGRPGAQHLCFDWESFDSLRLAGVRARAWEDYITPEGAGAAAPETDRFSALWHRPNGRDFTVFEGISLGKSYRFIFYALFLQPAAKFLLALSAAVQEHRPETIWCETSVPKLYRDMLASLASTRAGWKLSWVPAKSMTSDILIWSLPDPALSAPKRLVLGLMNLLAAAVARPGPRPRLALSYYPTLDGFLHVLAREGSPFQCLLVDTPGRAIMPSLIRSGAEVLLDHRTAPCLTEVQQAALSAMAEEWRRAKANPGFRDSFSLAGASLWPAVEAGGDDFLNTKAGPLAWTVSRLDAAWVRERPAAALLAFDDPPIQHLVTDIAAKHGTPSITVLHGLPEYSPPPLGGVNALYLAAWGPTLAKRCALPERVDGPTCLSFGNPAFDRHSGLRRPKPPKSIRKILVLSSPPRSWITLASELEPQIYARTVCSALRRAGASVVFKLHPAESLTYYLRLLKDFDDEIKIVKDRPILDCLLQADLVIGSYSTALLEALILNKVVLSVNLTRTPFSPPFDGSWGIQPLRSEDELQEAIRRLLRDPEKAVPEICRHYDRIMQEFVGPVDGMASDRLLLTLLRLASCTPMELPSGARPSLP